MRPSPLRSAQLAIYLGLAAAWSSMPVSAEGPGSAAAPSPIVIARADDEAERRARDEYLLLREKRRAEREREWRNRRKLNRLERELRRAKGQERHKNGPFRYYGNDDGQAGGHCMYGTDGRLIHAPSGVSCAPTNDGQVVIPYASPGPGPAPGPYAPSTPPATGCIQGSCRDGQGTYVWKDGSRYAGDFQGGRQHGQGSIFFADGSSYVGEWRGGKRSGRGTAVYADGRVRSGRFVDNRYVGAASPATAPAVPIRWPDLSRPAKPVGGGKHDAAVVIGIEDYAHVSRIPGARLNAADWYQYLISTRGVPIDHVTLLRDADATREEMRFAVEEAAGRVGRKGSLWFVFVGHGAPAPDGRDGLLIGFDAQQKARSLRARSFERSELIEILETSRARHIHVLLDACFSGRASSGDQLIAGLQPLVVTSLSPTSDSRTTLMTAARSDQFAGPLPGAPRPAFSYLVLGGLRGWADSDADGVVEADELHGYVSSAMRALIRGREQSPTLLGGEGIEVARSARERGPDIAEMVLRASAPAAGPAR